MSNSLSKIEKRTAYALTLPAVLIVFAIVLFPIFSNVWISFKEVQLKDIRIPEPRAKKIVKSIKKEERKKIWSLGIKIGRYHIYLPKMLKPKAVSLRISLWKLFYQLAINHEIPRSGLNYLIDRKYNKNFLLLCGFEKFKNHYVRIDILEKLFIKILNKTEKRKFKIDSEMINLIGCNKENFYNLMLCMNYKKSKETDTYFYTGEVRRKNRFIGVKKNENPFKKLLTLNLK